MDNLEQRDPIPEERPAEEQTPEAQIPSQQEAETEISSQQIPSVQASEEQIPEPQPRESVYEPMAWQPPLQQPAANAQPVTGYPFPPSKPKKQKAKKEKAPGKGGWWKTLLAAVLTLALVAGGCGITAFVMQEQWSADAAAKEQELEGLRQQLAFLQTQLNRVLAGSNGSTGGTVVVPEGGMTHAQVYAQNVNSVVAINNKATTNIWGQISETASSGSGFILSEDGYIVSNYHVVEGANTLTVIMHNGTEYDAKLIGYDEYNDLAVLKIDAKGLPCAKLGSSDDLIIGDMVVAIGNPLGELTSSLTVGYVSGTNRDVSTTGAAINMLQTDAAINPGNSGGPLFNMFGEVVGITTAKYSGSAVEGLGFAIPIDDVTQKITDIVERGYVTGAYLGVNITELTEEGKEALGIPDGVYVRSVEEGYCAAKAGVRQMDIITALGEHTVKTIADLKRALEKYEPGDTVELTIWRSGEVIKLTLTLDEKPAS